MNSKAPQIVHLFVFDTIADWEAALAVAAINSPRFQSVPGRYRIVTVAASLDPVITMNGVRITPDISLDGVTPDSSAMLISAWRPGMGDRRQH